MSLQLGYLLPTRERIMVGKHEVQEILALGDLADELGVDSVWIGDSLLVAAARSSGAHRRHRAARNV